MTREHEIEGLVRMLTALGSNPHAYADETIRSRCDEAAAALSSLAAENRRMAAVAEAATMLRHSGYDSRTMLFAVMCEAVDRYAALSSPAPEGKDEISAGTEKE